jgi:phosphoglucomutase
MPPHEGLGTRHCGGIESPQVGMTRKDGIADANDCEKSRRDRSALEHTFNQSHVLAISQAICDYRKAQGINGPLFLGIDTHALSVPACASAVEVLAANGVEICLQPKTNTRPLP